LAIAAAVAVVIVVLAGRDKMTAAGIGCDTCFGGPIAPSAAIPTTLILRF
jgi:hypothetical protein